MGGLVPQRPLPLWFGRRYESLGTRWGGAPGGRGGLWRSADVCGAARPEALNQVPVYELVVLLGELIEEGRRRAGVAVDGVSDLCRRLERLGSVDVRDRSPADCPRLLIWYILRGRKWQAVQG